MIRIDKDNIHLTKGDSAFLNLEIYNNQHVPYKVQDGDIITITVRNYIDNSLVFTKSVQAGTCIAIEPTDTNAATIGRYKYDIQLETLAGEIYTIIPKSNFYLEEEVTYE